MKLINDLYLNCCVVTKSRPETGVSPKTKKIKTVALEMLFIQTHFKERKSFGTATIFSYLVLFDVSCHSKTCIKCYFVSCIFLVCSQFPRGIPHWRCTWNLYSIFLFFILRPYLVYPAARHSENCSVVFESHDGKLGCDESFNEVEL